MEDVATFLSDPNQHNKTMGEHVIQTCQTVLKEEMKPIQQQCHLGAQAQKAVSRLATSKQVLQEKKEEQPTQHFVSLTAKVPTNSQAQTIQQKSCCGVVIIVYTSSI